MKRLTARSRGDELPDASALPSQIGYGRVGGGVRRLQVNLVVCASGSHLLYIALRVRDPQPRWVGLSRLESCVNGPVSHWAN
jgi:hypothetical protein